MLLFCAANICAEHLLHILGYTFCTEHHILAQCCQMWLTQKVLKVLFAEAAPFWWQKWW
jgi:hypothetical protein